ncbi:MAG: hypothetical protein LUP98_06085 [Methylococcaceae bacterium]|nr:hypothetical protein [Methylococcaceae bacterium]
MNASLKFLTSITFITLAACSTQEVKQNATTTNNNNTAAATDKSPPMANEAEQMSGQNPPMTMMKGDKKLNLVRIMDGGICKNEFQGAKGAFLLYADPDDIERIKREKGAVIFRAFETKIQDLSGDVLQEAIDKTNLSEDPFALGEDEAQQKLANKLINNFRNAAADAVDTFQKETTLTIDITAFPPSLVFYQKGCEVTHIDPEKTESDNQLNAYY